LPFWNGIRRGDFGPVDSFPTIVIVTEGVKRRLAGARWKKTPPTLVRGTRVRPEKERKGAVKLNRNHYFLIGLILLFLGLQFRMVDTVVLNEPVSQVVRRQGQGTGGQPLAFAQRLVTPQLHAVRPPKYIGWVLLSVGGVLVLQSFAMPKPGQ
jgi:hypothetical protein